MSKKGKDKLGGVRIFVVIWLLILGLGYMSQSSVLGLLFIIVMLYFLTMDKVNDKVSGKRNEKKKKPEELIEYDPLEYGDPISCPYCGKEIPEEINYCFYCGRSLSAYKHIEAIRVGSLTQIDSSLEGLDAGPEKEKIKEIRNLVDKILLKYEQNPDDHDDYKKFTDNYLPKTVSAIKHYNVLRSLNNLDSGEKKIQKQLEDSFDLLAEAFSNIYNRASTEGLEDVSTDISVLENLMKQEGLTDSDFH